MNWLYKSVKGKLRSVAKLQIIQDTATKKMLETYLHSKRRNGKLVTSSAKAIENLERIKKQAKQKETEEFSATNEVETSYLYIQKLLKYKKEIKEKGYAMTESRKRLFEQISQAAMSGKKVFLVGSTGTGKTELAFYTADLISGSYELISWHEGTSQRDLFGYREIWTDENGNQVSGPKKGPVAKSVVEGKTVIHDEYTVGSTRSQLAAKAFMNAKPGSKTKIPGFNGDIFEVSESFAEIYTGNPKDERTKNREEMDPAILRMLTGIKVDYMSSNEMKDIILANLMTESGVINLSKSEVKLIEKLTKAAEIMQLAHERKIESLDQNTQEAIKQIFGDIKDLKLDKNFLDPGTLFSIFKDLDFTKAKGGDLKTHLNQKLVEFINDPKADTVPEERKLITKILEITGVIKSNGDKIKVIHKKDKNEKDYILPSEVLSINSDLKKYDAEDFGADEEGDDTQTLESLEGYEEKINILK